MNDQPAGQASVQALRQAAELGPYFATATWHRWQGWRRLSDLADPATLAHEVARTAEALGGADRVPARVAASTWHLGFVARLTAPLLGAAVCAGVLPELRPDDLWWRAGRAGPYKIAAAPVRVTRGDPQAALASVIESVTQQLNTAVAQAYSVSRQILDGNVAASLTGAARVIGPQADAARLVRAALRHGVLRGTIDAGGTRRSCCLYYRVPKAGCCGDCVLRKRSAGGASDIQNSSAD